MLCVRLQKVIWEENEKWKMKNLEVEFKNIISTLHFSEVNKIS